MMNSAVLGDKAADNASAKTKSQHPNKKKQDGAGAATSTAVTLNFPPSASADPTAFLACFKDESSAYAGVAKSCLQLTQYAGCGSSAHVEDNTASSVASSALFHDGSYTSNLSAAFNALLDCLKQHKDRRCRILAGRTAAILARSSYARIRQSPLLFTARADHRLEHEVANEVPVALATAVLDDADAGVSACAMEALGIMTLDTTASSSVVEDELLREMQAIAFARATAYAPSLRAVVDEDPSIPQLELSMRIYENVLAPRLVQIMDRISLYPSTDLLRLALPVLTACLVHQVKTTPLSKFEMDRPTYAKRWMDVDAIRLVDTAVDSLLLPALQSSTNGSLSYTAALSVLRLAHVAAPHQGWVTDACRWACRALKDELLGQPLDLETKLATLSALIIGLRVLPIRERTTRFLLSVTNVIAHHVPSTTTAPVTVTCPGVYFEWQGHASYRRPARIGLWTEIAISLFVDGPVDSDNVKGSSSSTLGGSASGALRVESLQTFFSSPTISKIVNDHKNRSMLYDELLLVFTTVAVDTGRRLRVTPDGSLLLHQQEQQAAQQVTEWTRLAWLVLTLFSPCVLMGAPPSGKAPLSSMEEDLSLLAAGQASYVRLVQEYIYMVGLINPDTSVSLKLTPNALPPQMLWDQLSESALFLSRFEANPCAAADNDNNAELTSTLMDEFVQREKNQGIPSHHTRMFILSLAADHWVQGRALSVKKQFETTANPNLSFKFQSGREIVLALSPKRLIAKLLESHTPPPPPPDPEGKKKKDPTKKLAQETVRVCVACIETIALTACEWRRRFGSSQDLIHLVSVTVGLLQGKVDETPIDDAMRAVMAPVCEAAVNRIQAFYEKEGGAGGLDQSFPASELVTQPVKPKIKPLISPSKPPKPATGKVLTGHMMQYCRQIIRARIEQCVASTPPADSLLLIRVRPATNWLRLSVPPLPESKDARAFFAAAQPMQAYDGTAAAGRTSSSTSDAVALVSAYTMRRYVRYDGEEEYRLTFLTRAFNTTAIEFPEGIRLELSLATRQEEEKDPVSLDVVESLGIDLEEAAQQKTLASAMAVCKQEIKAGDSVTWEASMEDYALTLNSVLIPSVIYRNVKAETPDAGAKWVGEKSSTSGDASTATGGTGSGSKSGEDDFQVTHAQNQADNVAEESQNIIFPGEPLYISPMTGLQPCPLVFFRNCMGDVSTFRFFWFNLSHHVAPIRVLNANNNSNDSNNNIDCKLASMSSLRWGGEAIPGGYATRLWAFSSCKGSRVFCCLAETDAGGASPRCALHFRGDASLLYPLTGSERARKAVVAALLPGMVPMS